jgi:MYXO-CTERM domain-containing protein
VRRPTVLALVLGATLLVAAAPADEAASGLRQDPVYVDPSAEAVLPEPDAEDLRRRVEAAGTPVFVAVLPRAAGQAEDLVRDLRSAVGFRGTYVVVVGDELRSGSDVLPNADLLATSAVQEHATSGVAATLDALVDDLGAAAASAGGTSSPVPAPPGEGESEETDGSGGSPVVLVVLAVAVVGGLLWLAVRRRRREEARRQAALQAREDLRPSLTVLADDVLALEPAVALHEDARADYEEAVRRYRWAEAAIGQVDTMGEAGRVQRVLDEGHYAMARARAVTQGRPPPPPPPELTVPGPNREPPVVVGDDGVPGYVGWGGGWYGGGGWFGGDLLTGLAIGSILSGPGWGWGGGWGDGGDGGGDGGWGDGGGDGGDFGDIGGGDFGDFGDIGGGDF